MNKITVLGFGSLLSERSARETVPNLTGFRLVNVHGIRRIFNKVGVVFLQRYGVDQNDLKIASCSTEEDAESMIVCCAFECGEDDFVRLYDREHRFQWREVEYQELTGERERGLICSRYSDFDYRVNKCITASEYHRRVGQYYQGKIWRDDIFPFPVYLNHCLNAAQSHGDTIYQNFVNTTFMADKVTTIAQLLESDPDYVSVTLEYSHRKD